MVQALAVQQRVDHLERLLHALHLLGPPAASPSRTAISFRDSPEPMPRYARPGNISSSVAAIWATTAGWWRCTGAVTPMPMGIVLVAWPIAPSSAQACPE